MGNFLKTKKGIYLFSLLTVFILFAGTALSITSGVYDSLEDMFSNTDGFVVLGISLLPLATSLLFIGTQKLVKITWANFVGTFIVGVFFIIAALINDGTEGYAFIGSVLAIVLSALIIKPSNVTVEERQKMLEAKAAEKEARKERLVNNNTVDAMRQRKLGYVAKPLYDYKVLSIVLLSVVVLFTLGSVLPLYAGSVSVPGMGTISGSVALVDASSAILYVMTLIVPVAITLILVLTNKLEKQTAGYVTILNTLIAFLTMYIVTKFTLSNASIGFVLIVLGLAGLVASIVLSFNAKEK